MTQRMNIEEVDQGCIYQWGITLSGADLCDSLTKFANLTCLSFGLTDHETWLWLVVRYEEHVPDQPIHNEAKLVLNLQLDYFTYGVYGGLDFRDYCWLIVTMVTNLGNLTLHHQSNGGDDPDGESFGLQTKSLNLQTKSHILRLGLLVSKYSK